MKIYESSIKVRCYCEICQAEYLTETPEKGCPVCNVKKKKSKKQELKGGQKND